MEAKKTSLKAELEKKFLLANKQYREGQVDRAEKLYIEVLEHLPNHYQSLGNLGIVYSNKGDNKKAIDVLRHAIEVNPNYTTGYINLATTLGYIGNTQEAIEMARKAVELDSAFYTAWFILGNLLEKQNLFLEAIDAFSKVLELEPNHSEAYYGCANCFALLKNYNQAALYSRKALELAPNNLVLLFYVSMAAYICLWDERDELFSKCDKILTDEYREHSKQPPITTLWVLLARYSTLSKYSMLATAWSNNVINNIDCYNQKPEWNHKREKKDKITIGYLSRDFRDHPVGYMIINILKNHDRERFNIVAYSASKASDSSEIRKKIINACDEFVDINDLNTKDRAEKIYNDEVDILVELSGHTAPPLMEVCALKPAPVQISFLGLPGTTGAPFIDYIVANIECVINDDEQYYSEKLMRIPSIASTTINQKIIETTRADNNLPEDAFVFCCFNQSIKIEPKVFDSWMKVLKDVPSSVLWLIEFYDPIAQNLKAEAEKRGVDSDRIIFSNKVRKPNYMGRLQLADLMLDTHLFTSHTVCTDSFAVGTPVLSLMGDHWPSRVSSNCALNMNMPELVTYSTEEYEEKAIYLASNPDAFKELKAKVVTNRETAPLFNAKATTKHLELCFEQAWELHLSNKEPRHIDIE